MLYSARVLEYFLNPAHAGEMEHPDGVGLVGDLTCGDYFVLFVQIAHGRLEQISYQIFGCPTAIATCEAVAVMGTGKTLEEAKLITDERVAAFLGGLAEAKFHCSNSAAEALHRALADYAIRQKLKAEEAASRFPD